MRGSILDARGVPLADNETRLVVSASRTDLLKMKDDGKAVLTRLAGVLGMKPKEVMDKVRLCDSKTPAALLERLARTSRSPSPTRPPPSRPCRSASAPRTSPASPPSPGRAPLRRAPASANTAQVLGYLSPVTDEEITKAQDTDSPYLRSDQVGRSGLERSTTRSCAARPASPATRSTTSAASSARPRPTRRSPAPTSSPASTPACSAVAEYELERGDEGRPQGVRPQHRRRNYKADSGAVVVMEAKTGRVVAMASNPTYDPNAWVGGISAKDYARLTGKDSNYPLLNRAIQGQAAPGSIFKVVPTTAAVNAGYYFNGPYHCSSSYSIGGQVFKNFESQGHGAISLGRALEVSCDTVFYRPRPRGVEEDGGIKPKKDANDWFYKTAHQFGLGKRDRHRPAQRGHRPHPRPPVEAGLLEGQQGRLVQARQEGRQLRRADRLRELPRRQPHARR